MDSFLEEKIKQRDEILIQKIKEAFEGYSDDDIRNLNEKYELQRFIENLAKIMSCINKIEAKLYRFVAVDGTDKTRKQPTPTKTGRF